MTEDAKQRKLIQDFCKEEKLQSAQMITSHGYLAVVFSPGCTERKEAQDKLSIACTFEEWRAIGELIENEIATNLNWRLNTRFLDFLRGAINSIPSPAPSSTKPEKPNPFDEYEADNGEKYLLNQSGKRLQ